MIEKIGHIRNPLTVIAIFAGLAEVSGTVVLPFLQPETQKVYMWFLMGFPCLLVALFFVTLLRKHHVLYAPSDFRSDESFTSIFTSVSGTNRVYKLEEEVKEAEAAEKDERQTGQPGGSESASFSKRDVRAVAILAEELVIAALGRELGVKFQRNVAFMANPNLVFDAVVQTPNRTLIVEVKYSRTGRLLREQLESTFARFSAVYETLSQTVKEGFEVIFAVATDSDLARSYNDLTSVIGAAAEKYPFRTSIRIYDLAALEVELEREVGSRFGESTREFSRRIVGLLGAGKPMTLQELLSALRVKHDDQAAVADVQSAIGDLVISGRVEHDPASIASYRLSTAH